LLQKNIIDEDISPLYLSAVLCASFREEISVLSEPNILNMLRHWLSSFKYIWHTRVSASDNEAYQPFGLSI